MHAIAGSVTRPKLYEKFLAHYENNALCQNTLNLLVREDAKSDLRRIR